MSTRTSISLDRSGQFKYERIYQSLQEMIHSGQYAPGDRFPSEQELAKTFSCNYHTIRRSMGLLEREHLIERRVGAGTFVLPADSKGEKKLPRHSRSPKTATLGILCPVQMGGFGAEFIQHLYGQAQEQGTRLAMSPVSDYKDSARHAIKDLVEQGASAVILPWFVIEAAGDIYELVKQSPIPVVLPKLMPGLETYCYEKPDLFGMIEYEMMERVYGYFERLGYGHIAFLGSDLLRNEDLAHRLAAYSRAASHRGRETLVGLVGTDAASVDSLVQRWEKFKGDLAVICYDDDHAIRLLMALHKRNLRIPEDIAVIGFNNTPQSVTTDPPLSTIQFDYDYVARGMIAHARALAEGSSAQANGDIRETLIVRESCGGRARAGEAAETLFSHTKV